MAKTPPFSFLHFLSNGPWKWKKTVVASENLQSKLLKIASACQILKIHTSILVYHLPFKGYSCPLSGW